MRKGVEEEMLSFLLSSTGSNAISASEARQIAGSIFLLLSCRLKNRPTYCRIVKKLQTVTIVLPRVVFFHCFLSSQDSGLPWAQVVASTSCLRTTANANKQPTLETTPSPGTLAPAQMLGIAACPAAPSGNFSCYRYNASTTFFSCGDLSPVKDRMDIHA